MKVLPFVLSMIAGSVDVIGFLELGGLFIAHITGQAHAGLWSLTLPSGLSLVALAMSPAPRRGVAQAQRADRLAQLTAAGGADG